MSASEPTWIADLLIVDDTPANLTVLSTLLNENGYKVRAANSGERALTIVQNARPDIILLDIQMPGMNGYEVCARLKQNPATQAIPIIFITALDEVRHKVEAFEAGGVDYITKPFQILEVLARVHHQVVIQQHKQRILTNVPLLIEGLKEIRANIENLKDNSQIPVEIISILSQISNVAYGLEQISSTLEDNV